MHKRLLTGVLVLGLGVVGCTNQGSRNETERPGEQAINDPNFRANHQMGATPEVGEPGAPVTGTGGSGTDLGIRDEPGEKDVLVDEGEPAIGGSGDVGLRNEPNERDALVDEGAAAVGGSGSVGEGVENPAIWNGKNTFSVSGTLTEQNGNDLTISRPSLPPVQLEAHQRTKVTLNGNPLSSNQLDKLPVNSQVDAKFQINGDEIIATELKLKSAR